MKRKGKEKKLFNVIVLKNTSRFFVFPIIVKIAKTELCG